MDVDNDNPAAEQDLFTTNGIVLCGDLLDPSFIIDNTIYDEPQLYNMLAAADTAEAGCLFLWVVQQLSKLRHNYAEVNGEMRDRILERVQMSYVRYDMYCRGVTDDVDIVAEFSEMTL